MTLFWGVIIGMLIYSFIMTIATLYKDFSSYFTIEVLDIILAGPFIWVLFLIISIIKVFYKKYHKNKEPKKKEYKMKSQKYIQKIVKRIVRNYRKKSYTDYYIDFTKMRSYDGGEIEGYEVILVKKAMNERINNKFQTLMFHQEEDTIQELLKYFHKVTEEEMKKDDCNDYFISLNKTKIFYKVNK